MMIKKMLKYNKLIAKALALVMAMSFATSFAFAENVGDGDTEFNDPKLDFIAGLVDENGDPLDLDSFDDIQFSEETIKGKDDVTQKDKVETNKDKPQLSDDLDPDEWEYVANGSTTSTVTGDKTQHSEKEYSYEVETITGTKEQWVEKEVVVNSYEQVMQEKEWQKVGEETKDIFKDKTVVTNVNPVVYNPNNNLEHGIGQQPDFLIVKKGGVLYVWTEKELDEAGQAALADQVKNGVNGYNEISYVNSDNITDLSDVKEGLTVSVDENGNVHVDFADKSDWSKFAYGSFETETKQEKVGEEIVDVYDWVVTKEWTEVTEEKELQWVKEYVEETKKILKITEKTTEWEAWEEYEETLYNWILQQKENPGDQTPPPPPPVQPPVIDEIEEDDNDYTPPVNIPDDQPPLADVPEMDIPDEMPPMAETPVTEEPAEEISEIFEEEVPLAELPEEIEEVEEPEEEPEFEIFDEEVPLADLPQTGSNVSAFFRTLAMIAMAGSLAFAGAALVLKRKSEEK